MSTGYNFVGMVIGIAWSGRKVDLRWSLSLPALTAPAGMSTCWLVKKGNNRAENREEIAETALKIGAQYLFFLDDDTICPNFTLPYLHTEIEKDPNTMICGGIYCTKEKNPKPLVFKHLGGGPFYRWKVGEVFPCAGIGCGCMLIKTEVFQHLEKPWFSEPDESPVDEAVNLNGIKSVCLKRGGTDDLYLCDKVSKAGFKILAHGGVLPVHLDQDGEMYTLPSDSYPVQGSGLNVML